MKSIQFLLLLLLLGNKICLAQSISTERISLIKAATVRITIEGTSDVGSGFFINNQGDLLTCWHVVEPAVDVPDGKPFRKIFAEMQDGEKFQVGITSIEINDTTLFKKVIVYDFCELGIIHPPNRKFPFLILGNFDTLKEGSEIYTCGYPLGIPQQFVSQGMVSTKYTDSIPIFRLDKIYEKYDRSQALLDITLNKGNSGGAILNVGNTPNDDRVIGIADFILVPFGKSVDSLYKLVSDTRMDIQFGDVSTMKSFQLFSIALSYASNGISGCISINHYFDAVQSLKKKLGNNGK